jgi:hypothetical protein
VYFRYGFSYSRLYLFALAFKCICTFPLNVYTLISLSLQLRLLVIQLMQPCSFISSVQYILHNTHKYTLPASLGSIRPQCRSQHKPRGSLVLPTLSHTRMDLYMEPYSHFCSFNFQTISTSNVYISTHSALCFEKLPNVI